MWGLKSFRLGIVVAALIVAVAVVAFQKGSDIVTNAGCGPYRNDKVVSIGSGKINAEVVNNASARQQGLSGRQCIGKDQGMLFVFEKPGRYPFWMKDMNFAIDIVWMDAERKVVGYDINVEPSTYPDSFVSQKPSQFVLELHANRAKELKIELGTQATF